MTATPLRLLAVALATLLALSACTGEDEDGDPEALAGRLAAAKAILDAAPSLQIDLTAESVPDGANALRSAEGRGDPSPAFEGTVSLDLAGSATKIDVIAVDGLVYVKGLLFPDFTEVDPASINAPDPATFFHPETGVTSLIEATEELRPGERTRDGQRVLTRVTGTLPGAAVQRFLPTADPEGVFDVTYTLTDDDELDGIAISGPFYGEGGDAAYVIGLLPLDEPLDVTAP